MLKKAGKIFLNSQYALAIARNPVLKHSKIILESIYIKSNGMEHQTKQAEYIFGNIPEIDNKKNTCMFNKLRFIIKNR